MSALGEKAVRYYKQGLSCSGCIVRAASDIYGLKSDTLEKAVNAIAGGFGIGIMCSIPITCVLILGLIYKNPEEVKTKRLRFLMEFRSMYKGFNCGEVKKKVNSCERVIKTGCDILEGLINEK